MPDQDNNTQTQAGEAPVTRAEIGELMATAQQVISENAELRKTVQSLQNQLKAGSADSEEEEVPPVIPQDTFTVRGRKYKFVVPVFKVKGQRITAQDALADEALLTGLVEIGSGNITEVAEA